MWRWLWYCGCVIDIMIDLWNAKSIYRVHRILNLESLVHTVPMRHKSEVVGFRCRSVSYGTHRYAEKYATLISISLHRHSNVLITKHNQSNNTRTMRFCYQVHCTSALSTIWRPNCRFHSWSWYPRCGKEIKPILMWIVDWDVVLGHVRSPDVVNCSVMMWRALTEGTNWVDIGGSVFKLR